MFPIAILSAFAVILISADDAVGRDQQRDATKQINKGSSDQKVSNELVPSTVRTISIRPDMANRRSEVPRMEMPTGSSGLLDQAAVTAAPLAANSWVNWVNIEQSAYAMSFADQINAGTIAGVHKATLPLARLTSRSLQIDDAIAFVSGGLAVLCGAVLWSYVLRIKQQYDSAPIDPSLVPIDLARSQVRR